MTWRRSLTAIAVTVACLAPAPGPANENRPARAQALARSYVARELSALDVRAIVACSRRHRVDPRHLAAILLIERSNRSWLVRELELLVLRIRLRIGGTIPDLSLGTAQMRITTAAWVLDDFARPSSIRELPAARVREVARALGDDESALEVLARYLAHLEQRRYGREPAARPAPSDFGLIASEYTTGPEPLDQTPSSLYGRVAQTIAASDELRRALLSAPSP